MSLAIIQTGGKQYLVHPGDEIKIEAIKDKKQGDELIFNKVLLTENEDKVRIGSPFIEKAEVSGKILEQGKNKKITILKYKRKTRYKVKKGHRQIFLKVKIEKIK